MSPAPPSKILLVDDDVELQGILKTVLEKEGFEVHAASNGKTAITLVGMQDFGAVISDINMPGSGVGGIELLEYIQKAHPALPVILMTGFAKVFETKSAFELGAKAFLAKPFKRDELLRALREDCGLQEREAAPTIADSDLPESYCRIGIDQFISGKNMKYEIFIRLSDEKFTKIAHEGEDIPTERIRALQGKGVDSLYIKKSDFAKYVGFNLTLSRLARKSRAISLEKKMLLVKNASAVILENLFVNGVTEERFNQAREVTETSLSLLSESPECFDLLAALSAGGDALYAHSLGVSLYSSMIARHIGWSSPVTLFKVSTAGLLHDIGLKEIDRAIVEKSRVSMTSDEIKLLETHPARSAKILSNTRSISSDILQIILHHHEACDGHGYPSMLTKNRINPIARLISVADLFCELALPGQGAPGLCAPDAMDRLEMIHGIALDAEYLKALKAVVGLGEK
jgi:response regulator RpfG family c-di-GMP phosphodiesterase